MKKVLITGIVAAGVILGGTTFVGASMNDNPEPIVKAEVVQGEDSATKDFLSIDKVKEIALSEHDGHIESIDLDHEDGYAYYEVEIEKADAEYEIYIEAYTGEVLYVEADDNDDDRSNQEYQNIDNIISADEVKKIAVDQVGGKVVELELDEDDHRYEYELELKTDKGEVEMTIDAVTGEILEQELDD